MELRAKAEPVGLLSNNSQTVEAIKLERDAYKEKLEHLQKYIKEVKVELQSQRIRREGVQTVSILLSESKQEVSKLQLQKKTLETLIRNLQNRLTANGLPNSVTFEENELFIPGTSNQILDNLSKENARLRNMIGTPSEFGGFKTNAMLQETVDKLTLDVTNLQAEKENLQKKLSKLEDTLNSSGNDKDKEIANLREYIKKVQKESQIQDVLCHSLSGEIGSLRGKLHEFVVDCQALEMKLEESEKKTLKHEQPVSEEFLPKTILMQQDNDDSQDYNRMKDENQKLLKRLQEVSEMNNRWQDYNGAREKYVQNLHNNIGELEAKLKTFSMSPQITTEKDQKINALLQTATENLHKEAEEKENLKAELVALKTENQMLNSKAVAYNDDASATIDALKAQIQICTEDFETERLDREKAQNCMGQLKNEMQKLKNENAQLKTERQQQQYQQHLMLQRKGFSNIRAPQDYPYQAYSHLRPDVSLQTRGITTDGNVPDAKVQDLDVVDQLTPRSASPGFKNSGPMSLPVTKSQGFADHTCSLRNNDDLCCPKCGLGFTEAEQDKLLEHMEDKDNNQLVTYDMGFILFRPNGELHSAEPLRVSPFSPSQDIAY